MTRTRTRRLAVPLLASGLVALVLPWGGSPAAADENAEGKKAFSGYSTSASSTPLKIEIYEPTIPVPATPQAELSFGYSTVEADSSSSRGRSSYLWPGDPVGEGLKTIVEQLGLPKELADPIAAQGYPVQVNSQFPAGPEAEANEPFPGTVMRTTSADRSVSASTGFSSDCDVADPAAGGGEDGGTPSVPGLPELPELPAVPGLGDLTAAFPGLGDSLQGTPLAPTTPASAETAAAAADEDEPTAEEAAACQIPPALSALVDLGGYISTTRSTVDDGEIVTTSRASLGDVRLLGGLVTLSGIHSTATSSSDGKKGAPAGKARFGTITIAGQEFAFGPDGYSAAGQEGAIPGLPDDPAAALAKLGITLTLPTPEKVVDGDKASIQLSALQVEIDTAILSPVLRQLPLATLLQDVPFPEDAAILKSLIGALPNLAPRIVLSFANAESTVDTVQGITLPDTPTPDPGDGTDTPGEDGGDTGSTGSKGGAGTTTATPPSSSGGAPTAAGAGAPTTADLPPVAPVAAGLPPLFSIPGLLLIGGIALATVAGSYLRRLGTAALGGGASCSHGLDSGLPDLRKA